MSDPLSRLRAADPVRGDLPGPLARPPALPARRAWRRPLVLANAVLAVTVALHVLDHTFRLGGTGAVTAEVFGGGIAMGAVTALSLALALAAHRLAPRVAALAGPPIAVAVVVSHFLPAWSDFSADYDALGADTLSYVIAASVAAAALAVAAAGARSGTGRPGARSFAR